MRGQRRGCRHLRNIFDLFNWLPEYEDRWRYGAAARVRCVVALPARSAEQGRELCARRATAIGVALLRRPGSSSSRRQGPSRRLARQ